ncbi:S8 family peptidase [Phytohabitans sp. LJ34]|uniref:S8 family peptidase n=1 Tax=Phytohabitans sp. LJ34 TaxID=3452217 RepID=UPI003F8B2090
MRAVLGLVAVLMTIAVPLAAPAPPQEPTPPAGQAQPPPAGDGVYIVVTNGTVQAEAVADRYGVTARHTYQSAVHGFSAAMTADQAASILRDPAVSYVQRNIGHRVTDTQAQPPSWGLDRVDQRALPLDESYTYPNDAPTVHAYVVDTGVRTTHADFGGRAESGFDAIDGGLADDCHGHGTHVAGTIAGTAHGVAKAARVVAVRVLDCAGSGTTETVLAGVDWLAAHAQKPAVANMSLGGGPDPALDDGVRRAIASGVTFALSAGNGLGGAPRPACDQSPARVAEALTVSATDREDSRAPWANTGGCVDLFAPGVSIVSAWNAADDATRPLSGTSMAAPHVTGAAALYLQEHPEATPPEVAAAVVAAATPGTVRDPLEGTPNLLLYIGDAVPACPPPTPDPSPSPTPSPEPTDTPSPAPSAT